MGSSPSMPTPDPSNNRHQRRHHPELDTSTLTREHLLSRFFAGHVENVFATELGVASAPVHDYVSNMLTRFIRSDELFKLRTPRGERIGGVTAMVEEAAQRIGDAKADAHRRIGDFTLFWAGFYPEALPVLKAPDTKDHLIDYPKQGKYAYHVASEIEGPSNPQKGAVLQYLSDKFELCCYALGAVRRSIMNDPGPPQLIWIPILDRH